jgi:hypothetical protein
MNWYKLANIHQLVPVLFKWIQQAINSPVDIHLLDQDLHTLHAYEDQMVLDSALQSAISLCLRQMGQEFLAPSQQDLVNQIRSKMINPEQNEMQNELQLDNV